MTISSKAQELNNYALVIDALHKTWKPHEKQVVVGQALFSKGKRNLFIQCGRKWGKTELIIYFLYRWCLANPNSSCYYISPFQKQSKEIVWANRRLHNFIDRKYIKSINSTEMRITLNNGSFIKCDGSDNYESYRGIEPHFVVFEEFKDFKPDFYVAMEPNLSVYKAPLVIIGTPPNHDCQFTMLAEEYRNDPDKFYIEGKTEDNPVIDRVWLAKKKEELYRRGEWDVWEREYCGRYVKGGSAKIFSMLSDKVVRPHVEVLSMIRKDLKKLRKYCFADPAGASVFGVLFVMINPYSKMIYILDEVYETRQDFMTVDNVGRIMIDKTSEFYRPMGEDDGWYFGYDEAATWFANEMRDRFDIHCMPTTKAQNKKEHGLSLIKDVLIYDKVVMSDRCVKTFWELDNYIKDHSGKVPKVNDHNIDNFRYILSADMYDLNDVKEPMPEKFNDSFRGAKISDDFPMLDDFGKVEEDSFNNIEW